MPLNFTRDQKREVGEWYNNVVKDLKTRNRDKNKIYEACTFSLQGLKFRLMMPNGWFMR